ncbi:MAG: Rare lipoprotein precursor [Pseudomonadota bacterium]
MRANGPEADYPSITGAPYSVQGTAYKPEDVMNYDAVGYLAADQAGGQGVSAAHHTLPLPSYVEVTSLNTGRTILLRVERRGPMDSNQLVALSAGALAQLQAAPGTPVRVRRVNPPEDQRAQLRAGQAVAPRMDTPMSLVTVLKRKLPGAAGVAVVSPAAPASSSPAVRPPARPQARPAMTAAAKLPVPTPVPAPVATAAPPAARAKPAPSVQASAPRTAQPALAHGLVVQAGAFSTADKANKAAHAVGGSVSRSGNLWRVRTGPFSTHSAAEASLAKVRAAGYSDARIFTSG